MTTKSELPKKAIKENIELHTATKLNNTEMKHRVQYEYEALTNMNKSMYKYAMAKRHPI